MNNNTRIALNSGVIFVRLCVTTLIGLFASRVVLNALGASDYGLYSVVGGIVTFLNVVNTAMLSTTYRFIAFEVGKGEAGNQNKVFNTSLLIHAGFALLIILLGLTVGEWYINNYLNIDPGKLDDARFVFHLSLATTAFTTIVVPFNGLIIAHEKFTVNAIIVIVTDVVRFAAILMFIYSGNSLRVYSIIQFAYMVSSGLAYAIYCKIKWSITKFKLYKDWKLCKEMFSYALWTLFGALAATFKNQGGAIIINYFFGTLVNAAYAVGNQVESFIAQFAGTLNQAAVPQITKNFSGGQSGRSLKLTCYISKYTYLLMLLVAFPVLNEMEFLLQLWLKNVPEGAVIFCKLIVLNGLLGCLGAGIPALVNATGNIRNYQIITHTFNLIPLPIAFVFYKLGSSPYSITVIYCVFALLAAFLRLYLLKRIYKFDISQFISISYSKMLYVSLPLIVFYIVYGMIDMNTIGHIIGLVVSEVFLLLSIAFIGVNSEERVLLKSYISNFKNKIHKTK